ncbi:oxalate oxidoreductase subunit delta [Zhaonella formicivorans]|uniref:oxalate oxidoreductase subunit delta n=1 Tax=Zhaonella formicivorans TaxID=2528593 RepID=UPI0010E620FE|nr:2-oxoacid:acceptor oxidoreductase family protein [Zhaonella formicivorans]
MTDVDKLFEEPGLKQVTTWARGVYENKDARDVVVALTEAARKEGKYVQAFENYVDLPDRIYVPVRAYARISTDPIESKYVYENDAPNLVVLTEETLVKGNPILEGMKPGGVLVVNTKRSPQEIAKFIKDFGNCETIATVDASSLATNIITLSGAEGATDASGIGAGLGAALAGAAVKASGIVDFNNLLEVVKNKAACQAGYNNVVIASVASLKASA